ncbi:heterokaryon incompatibility protein-domain-containing protein [Suillus fuscotomentosus]|uniref:Heterokaryon incompatibility protein-domain-containing protein n=1 Tax=Suillus fuscotomentosus TaxID=1912939 RepID=A0AAD4ECR6_9AGAM|nr:heterokaryon incompatibility protein-domain-containing protein [Suillus fuscotomentosus]KAG1903863.1 heterokaryon incompatibility protein-domain-containing protein [Suillus fuscotomentosus]
MYYIAAFPRPVANPRNQTEFIATRMTFYSATQSGNHERLTVPPFDVLDTLNPASTHASALVEIIGGIALGVLVIWLLVVRRCKLKANVPSDGTSESAPLLNPDQIRAELLRDHFGSNALLCSVCEHLNFYQIFLDGIPETEEIPLDSLSSILQKSYQCSFCRLISFHVRRTWMLDQIPDVDLSGIQCRLFSMSCGCLRGPFYPRPKFRCYRLHVSMEGLREFWERYPTSRATARSLSIYLMQEDASKFGRPTDLHSRRVKDTVDIDLVKKWIKLCQENHGDECHNVWRMDDEEDKNLPKHVRLVDVVSMTLVPAPSGCCYVALSYVWGTVSTEYRTTTNNIAERSAPGGLNTAIFPETITDSILFTRQLGLRYLWIDALCIIQDCSQDKIAQIKSMDLVYGLSYLTVMAAGGASARDPLPGCRPRTRTPKQHIEVVQGLHLCVGPPRLQDALALSVWNTRCWTYQESALSRRRIYFTQQQVYFECRRDVFCEDIVAESKGQEFSNNFLQQSRGEYFPQADPFGSYMWAVKECTRRNLTVESDIIDALTGVTNALAIGFSLGDPARVFHCGMMLTDLHQALLWQHDPHTPRARRSLPDGVGLPLPSWTWATWCGAVDYTSEHRYYGIVNGSGEPSVVETFINSWYIVDHSGKTVELDVRRVSRIVSNPMKEEEKLAYSPPSGILDSTELTLDIHRPLAPGTLIFRTTSSHFSIAWRGSEENDDSGASLHHGLFNILSTTPPPIWVGTAVLPLDPMPPLSLEFIVLSRTGTRRVYDEQSLRYYHECVLYVMAVSQSEGLMQRVGLGVIHEVSWNASQPKEKVVFLR